MPPTRRKRSRPSFSIAVTMSPTSSMCAQSITCGPFLFPFLAKGSMRPTRLPIGSTSSESTLSRATSARMARTASSPPLTPGALLICSRMSSRKGGAPLPLT